MNLSSQDYKLINQEIEKLVMVTLPFFIIFFTFFNSISYASSITVENISGLFSKKPDTGAIFMKIKNLSNIDDSLIAAKTDIKGVVIELHDVRNGQMIKIDKIPIPPKSTVELKKGGLHIMLYNLPIELKEDQEFKITLIFEKAGEIVVPVKLKLSSEMKHHH
jgi:copper(I)-binding protein